MNDCQVFTVIFLNFLAFSVKMASKRQPVMEWTDDHDIHAHSLEFPARVR